MQRLAKLRLCGSEVVCQGCEFGLYGPKNVVPAVIGSAWWALKQGFEI